MAEYWFLLRRALTAFDEWVHLILELRIRYRRPFWRQGHKCFLLPRLARVRRCLTELEQKAH